VHAVTVQLFSLAVVQTPQISLILARVPLAGPNRNKQGLKIGGKAGCWETEIRKIISK
jgi:hypothetical protein